MVIELVEMTISTKYSGFDKLNHRFSFLLDSLIPTRKFCSPDGKRGKYRCLCRLNFLSLLLPRIPAGMATFLHMNCFL